MALNFLNSLKVEEQPLLSLSEMEENESFYDQDENSKEENNNKKTSKGLKHPENNLLPISDLYEEDDSDIKSSDKEKRKNYNKSSRDTSSRKYVSVIKALQERSNFLDDFNEEEFEDTPESLLDYLEKSSIRKAEEIASEYIDKNLTPLQKKFVELIEDGISEKDASDLIKGYKLADDIDEETLAENPEKAKKLYAEYLRYTTSFSEDRIKKEVEKRDDLGTLIDDTLEIIPEFKDLLKKAEEEMKKQIERQELQKKEFQARQAKELEEYLKSTEEIGGIKLTPKLREKWMKEYSLVQTEDGRQLNPILATRELDPNKFDALLRLYHALGLFKYDKKKKDFVPDFSAIKNLGKSEAVNELQKAVQSDNLYRKTGSFGNQELDFDVDKEEHKKRWSEIADKLYRNK